MKLLLLLVLLTFSFSIFAQSKVAIVKLLKGEAKIIIQGKSSALKVEDWVPNGAVIKTAEKSYVKLIFLDKSHMGVGANAEMKIESFSGKDSGVIDLVKGKIRSQVTKDYLQIQNKDKSKLFIKTPNAVMGVRGTDFLISTNGKNTSTFLFEGEIVFNKLTEKGRLSSEKLEEIVDRGVRLQEREFSVMERGSVHPTIPARMNVQQYEALEKDKNLNGNRSPSNTNVDASKSVVPLGLTGQQVSNSVETLKSEVSQVAALEPVAKTPASQDPEGYVKGDMIKPANGSFVHVETGVIIPPGPGSVLDSNSNTYIPGSDSGSIAQDGNYIPPKDTEITPDGKIMTVSTDKNGNTVRTEVPKPVPTTGGPYIMNGPSPASYPFPVSRTGDIPLPQPGLDSRMQQSGGLGGVNDTSRVLSGSTVPVPATVIVNPPPTGGGP